MIARRPLTITRETAAGSYVEGIWTPAATETFISRYSVQPTSNEDMARLPEGRAESLSYTLFGNVQLRQANDDTGINADKVEIYGDQFEVVSTETWLNGLVSHYKAIVVKLDAGAD